MNHTALSIVKNDVVDLYIGEEFTAPAAMGFIAAGTTYLQSKRDGKYYWKAFAGNSSKKFRDHILQSIECENDLETNLTIYEHGYYIWFKKVTGFILLRFTKSQEAKEFIQGVIAASDKFGFPVSDVIVRTPFRISHYEGRVLVQYKDIEDHQLQRFDSNAEQLEEKLNQGRIILSSEVRLSRMKNRLREWNINDQDTYHIIRYVPREDDIKVLNKFLKYVPQEDDVKVLDQFFGYVVNRSDINEKISRHVANGGELTTFSHNVSLSNNEVTADEFLIEYGYKE